MSLPIRLVRRGATGPATPVRAPRPSGPEKTEVR